MKTNVPVYLAMDAPRPLESLQEVGKQLDLSEGDILVDFAAIHRVDPAELKMLGELARLAEEKKSRIILRGVNVEIYKVLKLAQLASKFHFEN